MTKYTIRHKKAESEQGFLVGGKFALGFFFGLVACLFLYFLFSLVALQDLSNLLENGAPILLSLLVGIGTIILATKALFEQKRTREAATDPVIVAHFGRREDARELVMFCLSNVGAGAALNVSFWAQSPIEDLSGRNILTNIFEAHPPFTVILQGQTIEYNLALGTSLLSPEPFPPFKVSVRYADLAGGEYVSEYELNSLELSKIPVHRSPQMRVVNALEGIQQLLKR